MTKEKHITITVSEDLHKCIKLFAVANGETMTTLITRWVETMAHKEIKQTETAKKGNKK